METRDRENIINYWGNTHYYHNKLCALSGYRPSVLYPFFLSDFGLIPHINGTSF